MLKFKRGLSVILALAMILSVFGGAFPAFAPEAAADSIPVPVLAGGPQKPFKTYAELNAIYGKPVNPDDYDPNDPEKDEVYDWIYLALQLMEYSVWDEENNCDDETSELVFTDGYVRPGQKIIIRDYILSNMVVGLSTNPLIILEKNRFDLRQVVPDGVEDVANYPGYQSAEASSNANLNPDHPGIADSYYRMGAASMPCSKNSIKNALKKKCFKHPDTPYTALHDAKTPEGDAWCEEFCANHDAIKFLKAFDMGGAYYGPVFLTENTWYSQAFFKIATTIPDPDNPDATIPMPNGTTADLFVPPWYMDYMYPLDENGEPIFIQDPAERIAAGKAMIFFPLADGDLFTGDRHTRIMNKTVPHDGMPSQDILDQNLSMNDYLRQDPSHTVRHFLSADIANNNTGRDCDTYVHDTDYTLVITEDGQPPVSNFNVTFTDNYNVGGATPWSTTAQYASGDAVVEPGSGWRDRTDEEPPKLPVGWASSADATTAQWPLGGGVPAAEADATYYLVYGDAYTATFKQADGTVIGAPQFYLPGANPAAPSLEALVTPTGYSFHGWKDEASQAIYEDPDDLSSPQLPSIGSENVSYIANFEPNEYKVNFYEHDKTSHVGDTDAPILYGQSYAEAGVTPANIPSYLGHHENGRWLNVDDDSPMPDIHNIAGDAAYYAVYDPSAYAATFDANGGEFPGSAASTTVSDITFGTDFSDRLPAEVPAKSGYEFKGWSADGNLPVLSAFTMDAEGKTYKAVWGAEGYTITFKDYTKTDETYIAAPTDPAAYDVSVGTGSATFGVAGVVAPPANPTNDYLTFSGYARSPGGEAIDLAAAEFTEDTDLYALWAPTPGAVSITFKDQGGNAISNGTRSYACGDALNADSTPAAPVWSGHAFSGWYSATSGGDELPAFAVPSLDGKIYYARYGTDSYDVKWVVKDINNPGEVLQVVKEERLDFNAQIVAPDPTVYTANVPEGYEADGYEFKGWYDDSDPNRALVYTYPKVPVGGKTYVAKFEPKMFTVKYYVEDMDGNLEDSYYVERQCAYGADPTTLYAPQLAQGHQLGPWRIYDGAENDIPAPTSMPASELSLIAMDGAGVYLLTYTVIDEQGMSHELTPVEVAFGAALPDPVYPLPAEGYHFGPKYKSGTSSVITKMPALNTSATVTVTPNSHTVRYYLSKAAYDNASPCPGGDFTVNYGATLPVAADPNVMGQRFGGWKEYNVSLSTITETEPSAYHTVPDKDLVFIANLIPINYTVKFTYEDGTDIDGFVWSDKHYGDKIYKSDAPSDENMSARKPGYEFKGWLKDGATAPHVWTQQGVTVAGNMEFKAKYDIKSFKIRYFTTVNDANEQPYSESTFEFGAAVGLIDAPPDRTGYDFQGWAFPEGPEGFENGSHMPAHDVKCVGNFQAKVINVTFNAGEGASFTAPAAAVGQSSFVVQTNYGERPEAPTAEKSGFSFRYWEDDANPNSHYTSAQLPVINSLTGPSYTANYGARQIGYKVKLYEMGIDGTYPEAPQVLELEATAGTSVSYNVPKTGFEFDEAHEGHNPGPTPLASNGSTVLTVYYKRIKYNFKIVGVQDPVNVEKYYGEPFGVNEEEYKSYTGRTFTRWVISGGGLTAFPAATDTMPNSAVTIQGVFSVNQYVMKFLNSGDTVIADRNGRYGQPVNPPVPDPTMAGNTFNGWLGSNGQEYPTAPTVWPNLDDEENYTLTLTGRWSVNTYKINFVGDFTPAIDSITARYGDAITAPADPVKTGYTFKYWTRDGHRYDVPATMPALGPHNTEINLTAYFEINKYDAIFANVLHSETPVVVPTDFGAVPAAPDAAQTGYVFDGWKAADDTVYAPGADLPAMGAADATYEAQYTANSYDVIFDANGGAFADSETQKTIPTQFGSQIVAPAEEPTRDGYIFNGWGDLGLLTEEGKTIVANWRTDLDTVRVKSIIRVSPDNYYESGPAVYEIRVQDSPEAIKIVPVSDPNEITAIYYRDQIDAMGQMSLIEAPKGYSDAGTPDDLSDDTLIADPSVAPDYEIWTVSAILRNVSYKAYGRFERAWETNGLEFEVTFDAQEGAAVISADINVAGQAQPFKVQRGETADFIIETSDVIDRVRFTFGEYIVSYKAGMDAVSIADNDGPNKIWTISYRFAYVGDDPEQLQTWRVWYATSSSPTFVDSGADVQVLVVRRLTEPVPEGVDPFSIVSISPASTQTIAAYNKEKKELTVVTSIDVERIRLSSSDAAPNKTKNFTYVRTSKNLASYTPDETAGTATWVINMTFALPKNVQGPQDQHWYACARTLTGWTGQNADHCFAATVG